MRYEKKCFFVKLAVFWVAFPFVYLFLGQTGCFFWLFSVCLVFGCFFGRTNPTGCFLGCFFRLIDYLLFLLESSLFFQ